ncbi:hypothetical protein AGMMS50256_23310 [Betaproteobacteria bacterium]|nr:hypothetical protein AGMMS50256_23310 [Betaproteobacteria bacterium]
MYTYTENNVQTVSFSSGDRIIVAPTFKPAKIIFRGDITSPSANANLRINEGGNPDDLTLEMVGWTQTFGPGSVIRAHLTGTGTIRLRGTPGAPLRITGNVEGNLVEAKDTVSPTATAEQGDAIFITGNITSRNYEVDLNGTFTGDVNAKTWFRLGYNSTLTGNVKTNNGMAEFYAGSHVIGNVDAKGNLQMWEDATEGIRKYKESKVTGNVRASVFRVQT